MFSQASPQEPNSTKDRVRDDYAETHRASGYLWKSHKVSSPRPVERYGRAAAQGTGLVL